MDGDAYSYIDFRRDDIVSAYALVEYVATNNSTYLQSHQYKLEKLTQEFSAIGNNLNQLTRYFHMGGLKSKSMTDELTRCINEIMRMRKDVMEMAGEYRGYTQTHRK